MSNTTVTTTDIPKLTHDPSTYAGWRAAIEVALQLADCWNARLEDWTFVRGGVRSSGHPPAL